MTSNTKLVAVSLALIAIVGIVVHLWFIDRTTETAVQEAPVSTSATSPAPRPVQQTELINAVVLPARERPSGRIEVAEAYADVPVWQRPLYTREHIQRTPELVDPATETRLRGAFPEGTLEAMADTGDPLAMYYVALSIGGEEPIRALDLYYDAAIGGTIRALSESGLLLAKLAGEDIPDDLREAIVHEAYVRSIAGIMIGYGVFTNDLLHYRASFPDIGAPRRLCEAAVGLVLEINREREVRGMRALPAMLNEAEITQLMNQRRMCL